MVFEQLPLIQRAAGEAVSVVRHARTVHQNSATGIINPLLTRFVAVPDRGEATKAEASFDRQMMSDDPVAAISVIGVRG
jgi:hypothetical protein